MAQRRKSKVLGLNGARKQQKHVRLPHELAERMCEASKELGISSNELITRAVSSYMQSLYGAASDNNQLNESRARLEEEQRMAEAIVGAMRGVLRSEIAASFTAFASEIRKEIAAEVGPLREGIAIVISKGLLAVQDQVSNLIADSILAAGHVMPTPHRLEPPTVSSPSSLLPAGVSSHAQPISDVRTLRPPERRGSGIDGRKPSSHESLANQQQLHLNEIARRAQGSIVKPIIRTAKKVGV